VLLTLLLATLLAAGELSDRIDALVGKQVRPDGPGAAVLVVKEGVVLHAKGYGLADVGKQVAIDRTTTFDLASCSKQFTAYAILILAEQGRLALADDVRKLVPELRSRAATSGEGRPIRIEDLLHHVSGLPDYLELKPYPRPEARMTNADVAKLVATRPLDFPTGTKFAYSNTNYTIAALVIERATGRSYGQFLHDRIFVPLGMTGTHVFERAKQRIACGATGYSRDGDEFVPAHSDLATTGDGGVWSCLDDFVKWDQELRKPTLVSAKRLESAISPGRLDDGSATGYGLGWCVGEQDGEPIADHSGEWVGFLSYHLRLRKSGLTVVALTNSDDGTIRPSELGRAIAALYREETGRK